MLHLLAGFYGLIIGNYLTSAYFRIPRAIPINGLNAKVGKAPHCSVCSHKLKFYEYFPLFNWFSTWFKCNYCKAPIDPAYMGLEIGMTFISLILFEILGMNLEYSFSVLFAAVLLLNILLLAKYRKIYSKSALSLVVLGVLLLFTV